MQHCPHLVGREHYGGGCYYGDCKYNWHGEAVKDSSSKNGTGKQADELVDPPEWTSWVLYGAIAMVVSMGVLSAVVTGSPDIQKITWLYWFFIILTIAVNLLAIGLLEAGNASKIKHLKTKIIDHEKRIKDLESGSKPNGKEEGKEE